MNRRGFISKALIGAFASLLPFKPFTSGGAAENPKLASTGESAEAEWNKKYAPATFHYHHTAVDGTDVESILRRNPEQFARLVREAAIKGHIQQKRQLRDFIDGTSVEDVL
jgi:hypothetical protein